MQLLGAILAFSWPKTCIFKSQAIQDGRINEERHWATFQESLKCIYKPMGYLSDVGEMQALCADNEPT